MLGMRQFVWFQVLKTGNVDTYLPLTHGGCS